MSQLDLTEFEHQRKNNQYWGTYRKVLVMRGFTMSISRRELLGFAASFGLPNSLLPIEALAQARPTPGPPVILRERPEEGCYRSRTNDRTRASLLGLVHSSKNTLNLPDGKREHQPDLALPASCRPDRLPTRPDGIRLC